MHLTPREIDKLVLHKAGFLAQKRLARGLAPELSGGGRADRHAAARIHPRRPAVAELMDLGRQLLGRERCQDGVAEMIDEVQVEGTFPDGTKLVTVHHPIVAEHGDRRWRSTAASCADSAAAIAATQVALEGPPGDSA